MESNNINSEIRTIRIELEAIKNELILSSSKLSDHFGAQLLQKGITEEVINSIGDLLSSIEAKHNEPLTIFQKALSFLGEIEQFEFIAKNVMEALKRGDSPKKIFKIYKDLGILGESENEGDDTPEFKKELTEFWFNLNYKTLKSLGTLGSRLVSKSLKAIPEFIKIKTHFSPIPPFVSFSAAIEDSAGLDKLLEIYQDSIKETNLIIAREKDKN